MPAPDRTTQRDAHDAHDVYRATDRSNVGNGNSNTSSSSGSSSGNTVYRVRRDTRAWQLQVWASFDIAIVLCAIGLAWLPGDPLEQAFMFMGYVFCLSSAFVLAKFLRDNQEGGSTQDAPLWKWVVYSGFACAMVLTGWGLYSMDIHPTYKAFLGVSWLYLITCTFTLAKMLRDRYEADIA